MRHLSPPRLLSTSSGQATMEATLILIIVTIVAIKISSLAKSEGLMRNVVEGPWGPMRSMIENGVWGAYADSKALNPNHLKRLLSKKGDNK